MICSIEELKCYIESHHHHLNGGYLKKCLEFAANDVNLKTGYHIHHILPRCCGGTNEDVNLIKVSIKHHRMLHKLVLQSYRPEKQNNTITIFQYRKLVYAMRQMS